MSQLPYGFQGYLASGTLITPAWTQPEGWRDPYAVSLDTEKLLLFVLEALASHTERGLLAALRDNPNDQATRNAYIDYLQEQGRPTAVKLLQQKWTPGGKS